MSNRAKTITILAATLVAVLVISGTALADDGIPPFPATYSGTVYVGGQPGGAGLNVSASILDWNSEEDELAEKGPTDANSEYVLAVAPTDSKYEGETIYFYVNGGRADETDIFIAQNDVTNFNLHVDALPTATPTDANASTPTPTPTSTEGTSAPTPTSTEGTTSPTEPTATPTTPPASTTPHATPTSTPTPTPGEGGISWGAIAGIAVFALLLLSGLIAMLVSNRMGSRKAARRRKKSPPPHK